MKVRRWRVLLQIAVVLLFILVHIQVVLARRWVTDFSSDYWAIDKVCTDGAEIVAIIFSGNSVVTAREYDGSTIPRDSNGLPNFDKYPVISSWIAKAELHDDPLVVESNDDGTTPPPGEYFSYANEPLLWPQDLMEGTKILFHSLWFYDVYQVHDCSIMSTNGNDAYILLETDLTVGWAIVQWKDTSGIWHDVEGWGADLNFNNTHQWWIAPNNYEEGPFRWTIYDRRNGKIIAASNEFLLPKQGQTRLVEISTSSMVSGDDQITYVNIPGMNGAAIELTLDQLLPGLWTIVQWQDGNGDWHDVEGWQAPFISTENNVIWWVGQEELGTGPYRWLIYEHNGGSVISESQNFNLPYEFGQKIEIDLLIP